MKVTQTRDSQVYFCSDPHYGHKEIVRGTTTWSNYNRTRDFNTIEEHNRAIVNSINSRVGPNDILFCLGDWAFKNKYYSYEDNVRKLRNELYCNNIHLILGNHDDNIVKNKDLVKLFSSVQDYLYLRVKHENPLDPKGKFISTHIVLCHYALRVWRGSHRGSYHLFGHSHGSLSSMTMNTANPTWMGDDYFTKNYRTMDVGFDALPVFAPISFDFVYQIMENRDVMLDIDKHGEL